MVVEISATFMTDAPLISELDSEALERACHRALGAGELLIYVHPDTGNGASLAHDLRRLARYFEITGVRIVEDGVGVVGRARGSRTDEIAEDAIMRLLEQAVRAARSAQQDAVHQLHKAEDALRRRTIDLLEAARRDTDAQAQREALERKIRLAQLQTDKVKGTLSFRLGHALIHKTKSVKGVLELPQVLWKLQQDASARRTGEGESAGLRGIVRRVSRFRNHGTVAVRPSTPARHATVVPAKQFAPPFEIATGADLKRLRVAGIFDEFTAHAFAPECELISLHADTWQQQLVDHPPHLLFVESAWLGAGGSWEKKVNHCAREFRDLVQHCRAHDIPTAFWNKEDPIHFGTFLNTATLFDAVFTTDFDCLHRYRELLGHERVYVLPFACQPSQHNPIEKYERKNAACFAGAYYARYPERQRDFLRILLKLLERGPVEIFDRNHGKTNVEYQFPPTYRDYIVGNLPFSEIDRAYKGYRYAININSIKTSQSMFARRVFELLASNTLTVSNYAKGIRVLFGDLVVATDDPEELGAALAVLDDGDTARVRRLVGLRKALAEHTYQDRLAYVVTKLFAGVAPPRLTPTITVVGTDPAIAAAFERQSYPHKQLVIVAPGQEPDIAAIEGEFVARFADAEHYGEHYLQDLALATRYHDGPVIGMGPSPYRTERTVSSAAAIVRRDQLATASLRDFAGSDRALDHALLIDDFHYTHPDGEPGGLNSGVSLATMIAHADRVEIAGADLELRMFGPADLATLFAGGIRDQLSVSHGPDGMTIDSELDPDGRQYLYQRGESPLASFDFQTLARFHLEVTAGLRMSAVFLFFDQDKQRIGDVIRIAAMNHEAEVPAGAVYVRFGVLVVGPGTATVRRLVLGHVASEEPTRIIGRSPTLVVTNGYPSTEALYRNGFVHRRVLDYRRAGVDVDVFVHKLRERISYHEFEGTDVVSGRIDVLHRMLASNAYDTVLVHFLDEEMWRELQPRLSTTHVYLWIHGAEVQPWHRRAFNYTTPEELESAKTSSAARVDLWKHVLSEPSPNLHTITVSRTLANEIEEDYGLKLAAPRHSVIHNVIDTELFRYEPKPAAQRTKILSIRPFAARTYANDLTVAAILELAKRPWFSELDFHIIGDGVLFDDTVAPLQGLRNVVVERRFVRQDEIAALHRRHGVFLCPTRMDSQGVSRDEAMSSGLVPVTTRIAAVPEFVDDDCGFLAAPESAGELAAAIDTLYGDPARFQRMSAAAAERVRRDRSAAQTSLREVALFIRRS
jgi:glycosyltransferase involved in cell wall biosynthesis/spore maturation protein CgeB